MNTQKILTPSSCARGSVLFIILIAVALFGALSYTVASMLNSGEAQYVSEEKADIYADEILDYLRKIRQTVQFLKISNDCDDTEISFEASSLSGYAHSPVARDECKVFHTDGGGLSYIPLNSIALDSSFSANPLFGNYFFNGATRVIDAGTSDTELIGAALFLKESICSAINVKLGLGNTIPIDDASGSQFVGSYTPHASPDMGDEDASVAGRINACIQAGAGSPYFAYIQVLIVR